ncbi:MAG: hypothetical protein OXE17_06970 [Chloroflexi bacterium]|nr:hypothetical protein [Chloroflexota bacterium]
MGISNETMRAIIREYGGFELSDEELEQVKPEVDSYIEAMAETAELDLSDTMSSRLLRAAEGGSQDA